MKSAPMSIVRGGLAFFAIVSAFLGGYILHREGFTVGLGSTWAWPTTPPFPRLRRHDFGGRRTARGSPELSPSPQRLRIVCVVGDRSFPDPPPIPFPFASHASTVRCARGHRPASPD
jgi:hypothetical protein